MMVSPVCPTCKQPARESRTRYGVRHDCCGMHSWGGKPLESQGTHDARRRAHYAFDSIWQQGLLRRSEAYRRLAARLGLPKQACHMALMDEATALRVPAAADAIRKEVGS